MRAAILLLTPLFVLAAACRVEAQSKLRKPTPAPRLVDIETDDGVTLRGTYYPSRRGREATPIVLIADLQESRSMLDNLAFHLQADDDKESLAAAVLTIDLRGQGDSRMDDNPKRSGRSSRDDLAKMVTLDLEATRSWMVGENDAGRLNLNRLAYVGVGSGAVVAINAAARDWSMPDLASSKQGRDVKAVVMVSPAWRHAGLGVLDALRQPGVQSDVALMLMYGSEDRTQATTASRILNQFERSRGEPGSPQDTPLESLVDASAATKQAGAGLLKSSGDNAHELIETFLQQHASGSEAPWVRRRLK